MDLECGEDCVEKDELTVPVMVISPHGSTVVWTGHYWKNAHSSAAVSTGHGFGRY